MAILAGDLFVEVSLLLGDPSNTYHTISGSPEGTLVTALNRALRQICDRSRCLRFTHFIATVADQAEYALPDDFLSADVVAYSDGQFYPLQPVDLKGIVSARYTDQSGDPRWFDVWGNERVLRHSGTATGGSATTLVDTGTDFTTGTFPEEAVQIGDRVVNTTDNSEGVATAVAATTITMAGTSQLRGGADDTFTSGDAYRVESQSAHLFDLVLQPAPSGTDTTGEESIAVYMSRRHRTITQAMVTAGDPRDALEIPAEFEMALIRKTAQLALEREFGADDNKTLVQAAEFQREYETNNPKVQKRIREFRSHWLSAISFRDLRYSATTQRSTGNPFNNVTL